MDYYQWKLNEPGNRQGIVLASDEDDAIEMIRQYLGNIEYPVDQIELRWVCSGMNQVFDIEEL